jgi:hypothetical protein
VQQTVAPPVKANLPKAVLTKPKLEPDEALGRETGISGILFCSFSLLFSIVISFLSEVSFLRFFSIQDGGNVRI